MVSARYRECRALNRTRQFLVGDGAACQYVLRGRGREEDEHEVGGVYVTETGLGRQVRRRRGIQVGARGRNGDGRSISRCRRVGRRGASEEEKSRSGSRGRQERQGEEHHTDEHIQKTEEKKREIKCRSVKTVVTNRTPNFT